MEPERFYANMRFEHEWRKYQALMLDVFATRDADKRSFHVVAPPGSGKTLVGIEIARRIGRSAVTFSPTTTIQEQWREKVRFFLPASASEGERGNLMAQVSTDPRSLGVISNLTYQSLATQTQEREFLDRLGRNAWIEELIAAGREEESAERHLATIETKAPSVVRRGIALRARARKRVLLASGDAPLEQLLHPNALDLIERLVAAGTGCIILDEAHHLLDYWSLILADLIARLPEALVVGLTATPPALAVGHELDNYLKLVDGIDFEVPTPAVVRSGHLAPYQDLALVTAPTAPEREFIARQDELLEAAMASVLNNPRFIIRLQERINRPGGEPWLPLLAEEFSFAVAGVRYLLQTGLQLAPDIEVMDELRRPTDLDDRLELVREYCLGALRLSSEDSDARVLADVQAALRTLGLHMTETGWRSAPSPIDRVLAYSESKVHGMVRILGHEARAMGDGLRAVVLTDHERSSAVALRRLSGVLDPESGGAVRAIRALVADRQTNALDPAMITGRTVLLDADWADRFLGEAARYVAERGLRMELVARAIEPGLVRIDGTGPDWRTRHYVALITHLFERGVTRCLVGTRGLLAEGWDSLSLNTLVDMTTAGTFASVNQIRGRSIRIDPMVPRKVANNWDLVCHAPKLAGGDRDLRRLVAKHNHSWGIAPGGRVVKGIAHVDDRLALLAAQDRSAPAPSADSINADALRRAERRDEAYQAWGVGRAYDNFTFRGTVLAPQGASLRTAFTWLNSLRAMLNLAFATLAFYLVFFVVNGLQFLAQLELAPPLAGLAIMLILGAPLVLSAPLFWRYARAAFIELPIDSYLLDFGRAVAQALRETGLAPTNPEQVRVAETVAGTYSVELDSRDRASVDRFSEAYRDLFRPIYAQRYLVVRDEASLSGSFYRPFWYTLRSMLRLLPRRARAYHPVPTIFGRRRETAEAFATAWGRWVGGGELIYTRTTEGAEILLRERAARRLRVASADVEEWR